MEVYTGNHQWAMNKAYELFEETWNNGYDDGQSFGVSEVLDALRTIIKYEGGISEEVIDIILNAEYNEVQEYADALEREIHVGDEVSFVDSYEGVYAKGVVLSTWKNNKCAGFYVYSPTVGYYDSSEIEEIRKTGKHYDIDYILESLAKEGEQK